MCSHYEILFLSKKAANISAGATPLSYTLEGKITSAFEWGDKTLTGMKTRNRQKKIHRV